MEMMEQFYLNHISYLAQTIILMGPLIISGILHMYFVKKDLLSFLKIPINQNIFGPNKTYRGVILLPILTVIGVITVSEILILTNNSENFKFFNHSQFMIGLILGSLYIIFELPNSYIKRKLNISSGKLIQGKGKIFQIIIDQIDSAIGIAIFYYFYYKLNLWVIFYLVFLGLFIHLIINLMLYTAGLRENPL
jgi:hypothetical protein